MMTPQLKPFAANTFMVQVEDCAYRVMPGFAVGIGLGSPFTFTSVIEKNRLGGQK